MQCMKCGRDCRPGEVFCPECHTDMEKYPVKPGTVVLLPHYVREYSPVKKSVKKTISLEEQLRRSKARSKVLAWLLALFMILTGVFGWVGHSLYVQYNDKFLPGQNYSSKATEPADRGTITPHQNVSRETPIN